MIECDGGFMKKKYDIVDRAEFRKAEVLCTVSNKLHPYTAVSDK